MKETQQSISEWAATTFGEPGSNLRVATRAGEEMFELFRDITTGNDPARVIIEAADIAIVLYRLFERLGVTINTSLIRREDPDEGIQLLAAEANAKLASVIVMLYRPHTERSAGYSLQQVYYFLEKICKILGGNLQEAIDTKMAINRNRKWKLDGSGHGYHVKEDTEGATTRSNTS
jgi:hypothetical protein